MCHTGLLGNVWVMERFEPLEDIPSTVKLTTHHSGTTSAARSGAALQEIVDGVAAGRYRMQQATMRRLPVSLLARTTWATRLALAALAALLVPAAASSQASRHPLESADGLRLHNVNAEPATHDGKRGVRITTSDDAMRRLERMTTNEQSQLEQLAVIEGTDFASGVIEAGIAGAPAPGAAEGARGFVGIAFRVRPDLKTYDALYLRPTNGRADDQVRRNHSVQYISHPDWTWQRLRREAPERYESYVDLVPGAWTRIRIEVRGDRARLFVHGQAQPTLVVNDLKTGAQARGAIALWIGPGTVAHFRDLRVSP